MTSRIPWPFTAMSLSPGSSPARAATPPRVTPSISTPGLCLTDILHRPVNIVESRQDRQPGNDTVHPAFGTWYDAEIDRQEDIADKEDLGGVGHLPRQRRPHHGDPIDEVEDHPADGDDDVSAYNRYGQPGWYPAVDGEEDKRGNEEKLVRQRIEECTELALLVRQSCHEAVEGIGEACGDEQHQRVKVALVHERGDEN